MFMEYRERQRVYQRYIRAAQNSRQFEIIWSAPVDNDKENPELQLDEVKVFSL